MKKKHILVVSQYFYPEQFRVNDLCKEWVDRGYEITVLTGKPNYPEGKYYKGYNLFNKHKEIYDGINIIRLPLIPRGKTSIMLALNYFSFVFFGFFWAMFSRLKVDTVFVYEVSPMTQALPAVWFSKKNKVPCSIYVLDLWPENFEIITGIKNKLIISSLTKMVQYIYTNCQKIFVSSNQFAESIGDKGNFKDKVIFWPQYAEDFYKKVVLNSQIKDKKQGEARTIIFAGNVGYAQGLEILPETARRLKLEDVKVKFLIVGDGRYKSILEKEVQDKSVEEYFNFIDKKPAEEIPTYFANSDMSLISLAKNDIFEMTIPAKLQSSMACGIPVLVVADGEVNDIVKKSNAGLTGGAGDIEAFLENIKRLSTIEEKELIKMGHNSLQYYRDNFDKQELLSRMDRYLEE